MSILSVGTIMMAVMVLLSLLIQHGLEENDKKTVNERMGKVWQFELKVVPLQKIGQVISWDDER